MKRYICDGIVKGATHVRNQMPCQDNKRIVEISDKIAIVAVADGHGSSKCPRSDRGSMIAVNSFYEVMKNYLKVYGEDEAGRSNLITFLNREGDMRFAQDVCEEWQARVKQSFYKNKVEGMTDEEGNIKWPSVFSLYGTTLLGMLVTDSFVFSFQIGDGKWRAKSHICISFPQMDLSIVILLMKSIRRHVKTICRCFRSMEQTQCRQI